MPSAESGVEFTAWRHYRYWKGSFHTDTNPGHPNLLRYVYDSEGLRRADWDDDATLDESWASATNTALRPYASAHFEYDASRRVRATWSGGACGCAGTADGTHHLTHEENGSFTDDPDAYDVGWHRRVIVERPDGTFLTQYFDETGQPLGRVLSEGDPSETSPQPRLWATEVVRDASGLVTSIHAPDNVTAYTHATGSVTTSTTAGTVRTLDRATGDFDGLIVARRRADEGTGGDDWLDSSVTFVQSTDGDYVSKSGGTVGDMTLVRPLVRSRRTYVDAEDHIGTATAFQNQTCISRLSTPEGWLIVATGEAASGSAATSR